MVLDEMTQSRSSQNSESYHVGAFQDSPPGTAPRLNCIFSLNGHQDPETPHTTLARLSIIVAINNGISTVLLNVD